MEADIKRKAELFLAASLRVSTPGINFVSSRQTTDDPPPNLIPPYAVVEASEAEKTMATELTWLVQMGVGYITHIEDPYDPTKVREIQLGLEAVARGYDSVHELVVHGIDVIGADDFDDKDQRARGDVITLVLACSG